MTTSSQRQAEGAKAAPPARSRRHRGLIAGVGVVVSLVAVIALANRGWTGSEETPGAAANPLAPEVPHSRKGAEYAAAQMATAIGSEGMYNTQRRHALLQAIVDPDQRDELQRAYDTNYTTDLNAKIGLDTEGKAPAGATFVSRMMPAGTAVVAYGHTEASVDVWCRSLFSLTGKNVATERPAKSTWSTVSVTLRWTDNGWRMSEGAVDNKGPEPESTESTRFGPVPQL
ncbi:hypothetical protein PV735_46845 [Streptomyces turgidiscabies]|uniref:DUF8175 domain-containing protein n=1 Tax=Streptomyces turgidiscabies (strain Car8) TaxID=698760 RepID=L7FFV3_STRT8|nr:hypothetical protein [Streptomyces turgidiscabies]ELP69956.1 hypothetical protein STRTUCAR8_00010 [Streptomyces turgidiscabies Car8]MDX3500139.1 hypothetical protein [Streptomyces turgidiscabies]GAQ77171.1 hypothetical protein T45_08987 [Streptomyces turgidiscabies]